MQLITNPNEFFAILKEKEIKIRKPALILLLLAIVVSVDQFLLVCKLSQAFPGEIAQFFMIGAYIGIVGSFVWIFAIWFIIAAIMHALSAVFNGKGSFRRTFEFTGYGFFPCLIGVLITTPISAYFISQASVPSIDLTNAQSEEVMEKLILSLIPRDLAYSNLLINLAVSVWSLTLWTFAIRYARNLTIRKAFVTALIPTAIFAVYQIYSVVGLLRYL
jgi:hypothetical protein